jgi:hypothetical protein
MRQLAAALAALALAIPANAVGNFTTCTNPADPTAGVITGTNFGGGSRACYQFDSIADSPAFNFTADGGLICFDPDSAGLSGSARIQIWHCPYGTPNAGPLANYNYCTLASGVLDGVGGKATVQTACTDHLPRGRYAIDVTVDKTGAEKPVVVIVGE